MIQEEIRNKFRLLQELLKMEKEEDLHQFKIKMTGTSLSERKKQGVCWYPVFLEKTNFDSGERLLVRVSRPKEHASAHLFQSGKLVSLFSNAGGNGEQQESATGVVNQVKENEMLITLNCDDVPSWIRDGYLGVQLLFDENSYREMERALTFLRTTREETISRLVNVLLDGNTADFSSLPPINLPELNESQNRAVNLVRNARDVAIIHGPPGTGKTTTLVHSILQTLKVETQLLVCAPSNAAVDLLVEKLNEHAVQVLRIGHPARVTQEILSTTLDARIAHHPNFPELKAIRKQAEEFKNLGQKYKRNFGHAEREQRKLLFMEAGKLRTAADHLEHFITNDILSKIRVIACTLVGASSSVLRGMHFKSVFIDEAAQALEPACWIPVLKADRIIFAGDHCQLPPTIKSQEAAKKGLEVTLFEKAIKNNNSDVMLNEQYRMHEAIMNFSSRFFYKNALIANENVAHWTIFHDDLPVEFIDTAGCGFFDQVDPETKSTFNEEEAGLLMRHFLDYMNQIAAWNKQDDVKNIGIITPYKAQSGLLQELFDESDLPEEIKKKTTVHTVDAFQGQERDIIYISLVRSNEKGMIGFLSDRRRMNVAITRAKKKLVIIGDSATIGRDPFYDNLLDYMNEIGAYRSGFEFMNV